MVIRKTLQTTFLWAFLAMMFTILFTSHIKAAQVNQKTG